MIFIESANSVQLGMLIIGTAGHSNSALPVRWLFPWKVPHIGFLGLTTWSPNVKLNAPFLNDS